MAKYSQPSRIPRTAHWKAWAAAALAIGISCDAFAGIGTDNSLGHPAQALAGPNYLIPEALGKLSGSNLFHSFQTFNILTGESGNFTTATSGIANVISRVTGGGLSQINGLLSLTPCTGCGAPNFFFINPAGIAFGAGASIDVPGAFHVGTADAVKFPDGSFHAGLNQASTFSSAPPEAFGFLGTTRASVTINGGAALSTQPLQPMSVLGGDVEINNGSVSTLDGGDIRVVALGQSAHEIGLAGVLPAVDGNLSISNSGYIYSSTGSATDAGSIEVGAGNITIDRQGSTLFTGITSQANSGTGNAGFVGVTAAWHLSIVNGGVISSSAYSSGDTGYVSISAGSIAIDGQGSDLFTGIASNANPGSTGNASYVDVTAAGSLSIVNGGVIASDTWSWGNAGSVWINAGSIVVDRQGGPWTGISSDALAGSLGSAGFVTVTAAGNLSIVNGGAISSNTFASGDAGYVSVNAGSLAIDRQGSDYFTGIASNAESNSTGNAGYVDVTATGNLSIVNGGEIASNTFASGDAGYVSIYAGSIIVDRHGGLWTGISSDALTGSLGSAGFVTVTAAGSLAVVNGGEISSNTFASGDAGYVLINAGSIIVDRQGGLWTGISSDALTGSLGSAGFVTVTTAGSLAVVNGGEISSNTFASGDAGYVSVNAGSLAIDGQESGSFTGIASNANSGSSGNAGFVAVTTPGNLSIANGGEIASNTFASGDAGYILVNAGSLAIDGKGGVGFTGIASNASTGSSGNAGFVFVTAAGDLSVANGGEIASNTFAWGDAGYVSVNAGSLTIDGQGNAGFTGIVSNANSGSVGNAGYVDVTAAGHLSVADGGAIASNTFSWGDAGYVMINAGSLAIDSQGSAGFTGIASNANSGSVGNAGYVDVTAAGNLSIVNGGEISSNTWSSGSAGYIDVSASTLLVNGTSSSINASANANSSGQTGSVIVTAPGSITLSNGGELAIRNDATVADPTILIPTLLSASAPDIILRDAQITAASTGNVSASDIEIHSSNQLFIDPSIISTSANLGNGGSITIQGGNLINLINSQITTSVLGLAGNGGNINIGAGALVMNTGFIQANTAAMNALGGTVGINVQMLVPSGSTLFAGGQTPYTFQLGIFGYNVIQAAAPTGLSGTIQITAPVLDVSGSLGGLYAQVIDTGGLSRSPCQATGGSSLAQSGRGGLPPSARGLLRTEPILPPIKNNHHAGTGVDYMRVALSNWGCS